jgi:hypothetical protein
MRFITTLVLLVCITIGTGQAETKERYNFRKSDAYKQLSKENKDKLEQVHRHLTMLWAALDRYCDDHDGNPPQRLEQLAPDYLAELPSDPFATEETKKERPAANTPSKNGWGYRYRKGPQMLVGKDFQDAVKRSWVLSSVGLPNFPYLAERNNIGLYIAKGIWK